MKKKKVFRLHRIGARPDTAGERNGERPAEERAEEKKENAFARQDAFLERTRKAEQEAKAANCWLGRWLSYRIDPDHFCLEPEELAEEDWLSYPDDLDYPDWDDTWRG